MSKGYTPRDEWEARDIEEEAEYWRKWEEEKKNNPDAKGPPCPIGAIILLFGLWGICFGSVRILTYVWEML